MNSYRGRLGDLWWTFVHSWLRFNEAGSVSKAGLNWSFTKSYFRIYWCSVDLVGYTATMYYLRARWSIAERFAPQLFIEKQSWNLIESWVWTKNCVVLGREAYSDLLYTYIGSLPKILRSGAALAEQIKPFQPFYPINNEASRKRDGKEPSL